MIVHDHLLHFPNGAGNRECSSEYIDTLDARNSIYQIGDDGTLDDLSPEDYNRWYTLEHKLDQMQGNGHLGRVTRY